MALNIFKTEFDALIISNQPCENEFRKHCQVEIDNSGDVDSTLKQIKKKILGGTI